VYFDEKELDFIRFHSAFFNEKVFFLKTMLDIKIDILPKWIF